MQKVHYQHKSNNVNPYVWTRCGVILHKETYKDNLTLLKKNITCKTCLKFVEKDRIDA